MVKIYTVYRSCKFTTKCEDYSNSYATVIHLRGLNSYKTWFNSAFLHMKMHVPIRIWDLLSIRLMYLFFFNLIAIFLATVHFWMSKLSIFVILLLAWNCLLYILGNSYWYKKTCACKYLSLDLWLHSYNFTNFMFLLWLKYAEEIAEIA